MNEHRQKRVDQTLTLLHVWTGLGVVLRMLLVVGIVLLIVGAAKSLFEAVLWLRVLLG